MWIGLDQGKNDYILKKIQILFWIQKKFHIFLNAHSRGLRSVIAFWLPMFTDDFFMPLWLSYVSNFLPNMLHQVCFPELCGESVEFLGKTTDGQIALSNYRLFVRFKDSFVNVPLGLIESVEYRDIFFIYVCCKDAHSFR